MSGVEGRLWIDAQPAELAAQAEGLRRLLATAEADESVALACADQLQHEGRPLAALVRARLRVA